MNKIFKVIWSKSKQCYIVVSEMAKNHSGKKKIVVASILAAMAVGSDALVTDVSAARASVSLAGGNTVTDGTIAIGSGSYSDGTAIGGDGARRVEPGIAIGVDAKAQGNSNIVMGQGAQIIGHSFGVAIGRTAQATDDYGVSVGYNTQADLHGIAMGEQSRAKKTGATSFGVSSRGYGNGAIAVGWQSLAGANVYNENGVPNNDINTDNGKTINDYDKWGDVAIGVRTIATGGNATALGRGATASAANAIAIGGGDGGEPTPAGNTASDNKEKTKATAEKAVAIGYKALASDKNATSIGTDAQATQARATAIGYEVRAVGKNAVAIGSSGENSSRKLNSAGENAISIGTAAQANNLGSTAIGNLALASSNHAVAIGTSAEGTGASSTAIGHLVKATESNAFAAGSESLASGKNSISIGSTFNNITNQATGEASIAIGAAAQSKGAGSVALGRNVQALEKYTTAVGMNITASDNASASTILGYNSYTKANQSVNIGSTVKTEAGGQYSTAIGYTLSVSGKNAIGIGSSDDGIADDKKLMATGESSIAIGTRAQGKASGATAIGKEAVASHTDAIALGTSAQGTGEASTAIGNGAKATNSHAFAAGVGAQAIGSSAIAVGNSASALKDNGVAIGTNTTASEIETVAVGLRASAGGKRAVSVGIDTESTTADGVSVGYLSKSRALGAVAIGRNAVVTAEKSTAVGYDLSITNSGSTNIGYTSTVNANQAISVGARNLVEAGAGYGTALGYFVNISGKNAIGIGSSDDTKNVIASTKNAIAIGTSAQSHGTSGIALGDNAVVGVAEVKDTNGRVTTAAVDAKHGVAIGTNAKVLAGQGSVALGWSTEVNASDVVNSSTDPGATRVSPYLLDNIGEDNSNDKGNGIVAIGTKRTSGGSGFARRLTGVAGAIGDYDAVNLKQLKALESNEWLLRTQNAGDANPTDVAPQTVNNQTKKRVTLKAGDNIGISNSNGVVTLNVTNVVKTVTSGNAAALTVNNNNGAVTITPNVASSVGAANEDNKLVTSGKVKTALDNKIDKTAEMHIKSGEYTVTTDGTASLIQQNGNNQDQTTRVTIKDIAKKSVVDTLQSDYNTFKTKAITFTGDDTQGVARTLDTTLTVKGGANYTSTTPNTNIRVEKDAANGANGLLVKLSDKLSGMKEIAGTGSQDLVIKNGNTTVTVKAPANGDKGTVDFGDAKVIAKNLDASIAYKAGNGDTKKTVKLQDGFNFTAATDTAADTNVPKSGLAITTGDNGVVTFGLDKATRSTIDNAADKNLSNLSDTGKTTVKELAKGAAQDAVKVADGINTTVEKDTATAGVTTYKVNANDTTVAVTGDGLAITGGDLGTDKVRKYSLDLSAATKGKLAAVGNLATNVIGGTTVNADGTVVGPTFSITKADGTNETANTLKDAIDKLNATNAGQNTKISETAGKVTTLEGKVDGIVEKGMVFAGDDAAADKVTRKLGETLNIHGQNNITVKKDGTAADTLNVKLASELKNITSISSGNGTTGSTVTLGADGVSIANTKDGATKTVTIGKDGINAGGMKITNVGEAKAEGDAANKKYVDDAISNLGNIVSGNATLNFAGNVTKNAQDQATEKVGLSLATGTLHVNGAENEITTTAKGDTITVGLAETVKAQLAKVGDTSSNGRDGKDGTSGAKGLTGKDGLNDKTLTEKVNALRNGEAGSVVYTDENGTRLVKAKDGEYYKAADVDATGNVLNGATKATTVEARVVNPDGTTTGGTTKLSNIADGKVAAGSKDAVNGGQLHTAKSEIGAIIGGTTINENGKITGPTFSITNEAGTAENAGTIKEAIEKLDAANKGQNTKISENTEKLTKLGETVTTNYNDLSKKITDGATNITNTLTTKGLDFTGNDITDAGKVHRDLGTTLTIKGTENFTRAATENNIKVVKNGDALDVKLAENLAKMKEISGDGTSDLVIKNGDTKVTVKAPTNGEKGTVDFGDAKVIAKNLDTSIAYKSNQDTAKKTVKLQDGFNFTAATDTTVTAEGPKSGLAITTGDNGVVTFGLDKATRSTIDNAADKDLSNLTDTGKTTVKELAKGAAQDAVKVADGINTTVEKDTTTTAGVTTYKVNANDTTVAVTGDGLAIKGGDLGTDKVRKYSLDLSDTVKAKLNAINNVGDTASNGRDGVNGASGAKGLTGKDGLNDKTLTDKVNALRNGEAGSVVYTDENGARLVKAKDGEYYKAVDVDKDGNVLNGATKATTVEARVVNPDGTTTGGTTKLSNIADGKVAAGSKDAVNGGQLNTVKSDLATALGGDAKVENGVFTGPTYNITKDDGSNTKEAVNNVGDAISKLDGRINNANTALGNKGLDFYGNKDAADTDKVHRNLGEALKVKGAENFTRAEGAKNNIDVVKNTAGDGFDVKLAENLGNIKSISNVTGSGKPGSTITLGADGVSIANTAAGADGAAGETKTVTIGKDGINAGGMKITNVTKAEADGDAANKKYVDDAISNLGNIVSGNATLNFAGNVTKDGQDQATEKVGLSLATGTLHVNGAENEITTTAKGDTITVGLAETVKAQLAKVGDTSSNGRDGKDGTSGAQGLTGKDGLNDKTLTDKVNALRNGEAGSVVYTDENGARLVKAKDGEYYKAADVDKDGNVLNGATKATTVEARVVNPDGTTTGGTTKLSNIADGKVAANSKDAVNGGQLNTVKTDLANALGGNAKVENGTFTGPTYNITKDDGSNTKEAVNNVGDAISKLDGRINNANTTLATKGLDFYGNKDAADTDKVHRNLGEALKVKGAENFTRAEGAKNNIDVVKNTAGDGFDVKLAENLANMKEISGNGKDDLVIKNGDATITLKPKKDAEGTNPATPATVDFGDTKVVASNLDASIKYRANDEAATNAKSVKLADGFNFVASTDATTTADGPKSGLAISAEDNGKVTFGLDKATREKVDNAADKNLSNLSDDGENKVKELAKGAAQDAVKVADGINTTVTTDTTTTSGVTTYKVNANDTTVAVTGDGLAITGGDLGADKVRKYSLDLSAATKGKLKAVDGLSTVIGGTNITTDGTVTGPTFNITKADGTTEEATTIKDAIDKLNATNAGQNTKISETAGKVTTLEGKVDGIVEKGMVFAGDDATADKVTRKLGETLNIHGQNNITVKKDGTAVDTLNVKLASELKNITSITNADADGKPGSKITLGADGVSIANTAAGADGAAGETKTVTIGKDGINAGGMKITNVTKAEADGDAANKKYVDDAIKNLNTTVTNNANLRYAGDTNEGAVNGEDHLNLPLATGTLKVAGTADQIKTVANNGTITLSLDKKVTDKLAKLGDTASNGRDGKDGTSGAQGLTGKDGLNDKTLTDKVNALRNGEAGSVVYTNDAGDRVVKAKDGKYYKADEVKADGTVKTAEENNGKAPKVVENPQARVVNGNGETTVPTTLSNIADGKVAANSKDAVNGGQLYTAKSEIGAIIGGTTINENGTITGPTFSITKADGTAENAGTIKEAIEKLDATNAGQNAKISGNTEKLTKLGETVTENYNDLSTKITQAGTNVTNALTTKGLDFTGNDTTAKVHRNLGETLTIKGAENFTRTATEINNIKVVKTDNDLDVKLAENLGNIKSISNTTREGKPGSTITLGADGVSIANTAAGADGAAGETKTVTIGKDGINAGGMKVTNVAKAEADGDAANKKYVDDAITNLNTTVTNNANLRYAGDTNVGAAADADHLNLPLATGTLKVAGTADQIKTVANNGTITLSLDEKVTNKLDKLGDTSSNGRDGKDGTSGATGLTGKDGLNDKTLTDKVNALRNGEAGSVVYTNDAGDRVVKAKDGKYYKADEVKADGTVKTAEENKGKKPEEVTTPQARVVNPNGETTAPTTLSNIADGKVAANSKDAVNGGQLHTVKSDLATALGGDSKVNADGSFTGPTYNITKADGTGTETASNVGEAISKLDTRITTANGTLVTKGLDFTGNDTTDTGKVHRDLGTTLTIKGADNFARTATETNNIKVVKNNNDLDVKLAENLGNIKEIAGNGKDNLVIKNGDATITLKPKKDAEGTNPATPATVDFGDTKVVASNLDASIKYRANDEAATNAKSVKLADGFNFVASTDATTTAEGPKSGLAITAEDNGKVTFGLDKATREKVDNAADKNLSNLTDAGKNKVKELAGEAAKAAVTVADGINTTVTTDTTTTTGVTTYKVNANDTTVAVNADSLAISGGTPDATTKVRAYTLDLSDTVKAKLNAINNVGDTASNGRDGVNGTSGATGLTGKDGLNDKTLTDKVNALRNGEAGSVVYTNDAGDRVVKAKDGKYYKADEVKADGTVKTAEENKGKKPEEVTTPQARVVNPNGETTAPTTLSNIADGKVAADSKDAVNGGQLHTVKSDLATALGGGAKVENGTFTGPTYNITKDDGTGTEAVKNVGDAISKLDGRINNANTALANKGLDFTGNDTTDVGKVHRNLGETLTIKGADNFTRTDAETNNIKVVKNNNDLDVKLAENLGNIKEIAGNGKDNLVIKNGDATITLKPKKDAEGTNPATPATVDFGNAKVVAPNLEASITYRANSAEDADAKTVTLQKGLNFVSGDGTAATAEAAKAGITIAADKDGKVVFGLNETTRNAIDNAADKNLNNLSQEGKDKVADLAKTAARDAVKVTAGNNVTVTSETKDGNTTYTVNGRDTTVKAADNGSVSVTGGTLNAKGEREYTVDLTADAKAELGKISDLNTRLGSAEGKITTLQGDMTKAKDDIAANTKAIDANKEAIAANKNAIADNARDIAANRKDIDTNKQGIAENKKQIGENTKAIAKNAEDIKKNAQDIKNNTETIKSNTDRIQTVENRVTTAEGKIATNEKAIKDNASAIQSNTKAIGANTTAIAKNANDITKANKEIESLKGNSATKDLSNLTNTGKDTITNLINVTGEHGITVTPSTDTTTRVKTFTAKLNDTVTFGSGDKKITVDGTTGTVTSKAVAADTVKANTVNAKTVQLGDSTGTNTTVTADGIAVTTKNPDGTTSKVEIKNGTVSGLTNTKWDPAKVVTEADRSVVATQGQVKDVTDTLARGRVFVGDTGSTVTVGLGDTLGIKGGATGPLTDGNIGVVSTTAKDGKPATMTVKLAKNVNMKDGSTSYDSNVPEVKINPDGSKEIVKNADGTVKYQLGEDGKPIHITTTVNAGGVTIAPNQGSGIPTVSLTAAGLDNGGHQIHNVAAGTANTDAATVGQVRAAAHALNNRVNEAGAHAAALAAMNPLSYDPLKKSQVMAGVGSYKGNKALALGVAHYANEDTLFNVGVAVGDGSNMVNAGVTYRFGGEDSAVPERYKGGPISSVYVMQDEVSALKAENAEMKEQMKMLMERIEMLAAK